MGLYSGKSSVIVIHDTNNRYDYDSVKKWFAASDFRTCEAADLFDAIDKMSDFTGFVCPDVFLVKVRPGSQQDKMVKEFGSGAERDEVPIAVLSDNKSNDERKSFNFGSVRRLKANLDCPPLGLA